MRKRIGIVLIISGAILLIRPNFDFAQYMMALNYYAVHYWPAGFILIGGLLIWPQKQVHHKKRKKT
ncbi:MAG: hypothetical protein HFF02_03150 [Erysipelotrichaceae bacterium]|nr:hypothetical protein [Erysipelotrichaceae bacterium]